MCCTIGLMNWKRGAIFQPGKFVVLSKASFKACLKLPDLNLPSTDLLLGFCRILHHQEC